MGNLTLTRNDNDIYSVCSDSPYWADGSPINCLVAFKNGMLSSTEAQRINNARNSTKYIIVNSVAIGHSKVLRAAAELAVGNTVVVEV